MFLASQYWKAEIVALVLSNLTSIVTSLPSALPSLAQEITAIFGSVFSNGNIRKLFPYIGYINL
jgi:hypothetical protein